MLNNLRKLLISVNYLPIVINNINRQLYISTIRLNNFNLEEETEDNYLSLSESKPNEYINKESEYGFGRRYFVKKLQELFKLQLVDAHDIALAHRDLWKVTGTRISENYQLCKKEGVPDDLILKCIALLSEKNLNYKIHCLKNLSLPLSDCIPFATLELRKLTSLIRSQCENIKERIQFFSELFQLPKSEVCLLLTSKPFLRSISLVKAEGNYKLMLKYGITREQLIKDVWALRYGTEVIEERLGECHKNDIIKVKPWMIRANKTIYESYVKRRTENKEILGECSIAEYLSQRLECAPEQIQLILHRLPALEHKSMPKLKATLDYLLSAGFQPYQIVRSSKILLHSVETTKSRLQELEQAGLTLDSLYMLTKSQKQFLKHFEIMKSKGQ